MTKYNFAVLLIFHLYIMSKTSNIAKKNFFNLVHSVVVSLEAITATKTTRTCLILGCAKAI